MKLAVVAMATVGLGCISPTSEAYRSNNQPLPKFQSHYFASAQHNSRYYRKAKHYYDKYRYYYQYRHQYPRKYARYYRKYQKYLRRAQRKRTRMLKRAGHIALPRQIPPPGERTFVFSPRYKAWAAYDENGYRLAGGRANGGSSYCADLGRACRTPVGSFRVYSKGSPNCVSRKFPVGRGGAPMPYCMFFRGGYAIHGSPYISNINGSHGCIRVTTSAAQWLHSDFIKPGTRVKVLPY